MDNLLEHLRQLRWDLKLGIDSLIIYVLDEEGS